MSRFGHGRNLVRLLVKGGRAAGGIEVGGIESTTLENLRDRASTLVEQDAPGARELADVLADVAAAIH